MSIFETLNPFEDIRSALIMIVLFMFIGALQNTVLGQNKNTSPILESTKSSLSLIDMGYALADAIFGLLPFMILFGGIFYFVLPKGERI